MVTTLTASKRILQLKRKTTNDSADLIEFNKLVYDRVMSQTKSEATVVRLAKGLSAFLAEKDIAVDEADVFAGRLRLVNCRYSHPYENRNELNAILEGPHAAAISQKEKESAEEFLKGVKIGIYQRWPSGHVIGGYEQVLADGFGDRINKARAILAGEDYEKKGFAQAALISCEAARDYIFRYSVKAREAMPMASSADQKQLERIAAACEWVSEKPPRNFFEAIQLFWFTHEIIVCEQVCGSLSVGRLDQILYPFYARDLAAGDLTKDEASELIEALWVKFGSLQKAYQNVTLGGVDINGHYAVNDLTYMCLRATKKLKMDQPLLSVRWHESIPKELWDEIQELIEMGLGFPALFNDAVCIDAKRRVGVSTQDAYNYGVVGCVEMSIPGKEFGHTECFRFNWAKVLEIMLNHGICTLTGETMLMKNNRNLEDIKSFDDFYTWFRDELLHFLDLGLNVTNFFDARYHENYPTPFLSAFMEGCLENGGDVTSGTTVYNITSVNAVGMADVADSMAALKKTVFEKASITLSGLSEVLRNNFVGSEKLRAELINQCAKFGNDQNEADVFMQELSTLFCDYVDGFTNPRNGRFQTGFYSVEAHAFRGLQTGALPDGRLSGAALASALSPCQGADILGPTAVMKSVTKLDHGRFGNGMVLDLKFHPAFFENDKHRKAFKHMVETYFSLGGMEVQFNVVCRDTLLKAQLAPEEYRDLIVRVSGFSAYFVTLDRSSQDEIISRTEHSGIQREPL